MALRLVDAVVVTSPAADAKPIVVDKLCAGREYWCELRGSEDAGVDDEGHELHALVEMARAKDGTALESRLPSGASTIKEAPFARVGLRGRIVLRYAGRLHLVGGQGTWRLAIWEGRRNRLPCWQRLPARIPNGGTYQVPSFAQRMGAFTTAAFMIGTVTITLDHKPVPIPGTATGATLQNRSGATQWIWTEYRG